MRAGKLIVLLLPLLLLGVAGATTITYDDFGSNYKPAFWTGDGAVADLGDGTTNLSTGYIESTYINRSTDYNVTWRVKFVNLTKDVGHTVALGITKTVLTTPHTFFKIFDYVFSNGDGYVQAYCANSSGQSGIIPGLDGQYLDIILDGVKNYNFLNKWHNITVQWSNDSYVRWIVDGKFVGGCNATSNTNVIPDISTPANALRIFEAVANSVNMNLIIDWIKVDMPYAPITTISNSINNSYESSSVNLSYTTSSSLQTPNHNCTVAIDGVENSTYTTTNGTLTTMTMTGLGIGYHNVSVNCFDGVTNSTDTEYFSTEGTIQMSASSPTNKTYWTTAIPITYKANSTHVGGTYINCTVKFDGVVNDTYTDVNNTQRSFTLTQTIPTYHNVSINCGDGNENLTRAVYYSVDDVNYTVTQNTSGYETSRHNFNISVSFNPDLISSVESGFFWNGTFQSYDGITNTSSVTNRSWISFSLPIIGTNNTAIGTLWNITKFYTNGTKFEENTTNTNMNVLQNYILSSTKYSYNILEIDTQDIKINITKLNGLDLATINTAIITYNGSPYNLTRTLNNSGYYTYAYTGLAPSITNLYNATNGFTLSINLSAQTDDGYHSRLMTNTTYNYTQTLHNIWLGKCEDVPNSISTQDYIFYNENNNSAMTAKLSLTATIKNITQSLEYDDNELNYTICVLPSWINTIVNADVAYYTTGFSQRYYYLNDATISNVTATYNLYLLSNSQATSTTIKVRTTGNVAVPGQLVIARREYVGEGIFKAVAQCITNDDGECSMALEWTTPRYDFQVLNETRDLIKTTSPTTISTSTIIIEIGEPITNLYWQVRDSLAGVIGYTNSSGNITFYMNILDTSGQMSSATLKVNELSMRGDNNIYEETIYSSSGTLYVNVGSVTGREFTITGTGVFSGTNYILNSTSYNFRSETTLSSNVDSPLFMLILIITFSMLGLVNPTLSLIMGVVGIGLCIVMGLTLLGIGVLIGLILSITLLIGVINRGR